MGCPGDNSYNADCTDMIYSSGIYSCVCAGDFKSIKFTSSISQPVRIGCLDSADTDAQYEADCERYIYS